MGERIRERERERIRESGREREMTCLTGMLLLSVRQSAGKKTAFTKRKRAENEGRKEGPKCPHGCERNKMKEQEARGRKRGSLKLANLKASGVKGLATITCLHLYHYQPQDQYFDSL